MYTDSFHPTRGKGSARPLAILRTAGLAAMGFLILAMVVGGERPVAFGGPAAGVTAPLAQDWHGNVRRSIPVD